jgi:hypothetical protein
MKFTGWWFGTFFIFPNSWDDEPWCRLFLRGVETTNQTNIIGILGCYTKNCHSSQLLLQQNYWDTLYVYTYILITVVPY